ncbi:hypothetical protein HHI36_011265 [Cryptolaemus montrouzieri]|uniref:Uncharacterized protein n=1 Tax=Cryptolaemus montrouzieri TaxID=559131 RepID=A0ABD2MLC0_9CUCU
MSRFRVQKRIFEMNMTLPGSVLGIEKQLQDCSRLVSIVIKFSTNFTTNNFRPHAKFLSSSTQVKNIVMVHSKESPCIVLNISIIKYLDFITKMSSDEFHQFVQCPDI